MKTSTQAGPGQIFGRRPFFKSGEAGGYSERPLFRWRRADLIGGLWSTIDRGQFRSAFFLRLDRTGGDRLGRIQRILAGLHFDYFAILADDKRVPVRERHHRHLHVIESDNLALWIRDERVRSLEL